MPSFRGARRSPVRARCSLGVLRIAVVWLATVVSVVGWIVLVGEALWHGGFYFFAFTLGVAGAVVAVEGR